MHLEDVPLGHAVCKVSFRCIHAYEESFERFFGLLDGVRAPSVAISDSICLKEVRGAALGKGSVTPKGNESRGTKCCTYL